MVVIQTQIVCRWVIYYFRWDPEVLSWRWVVVVVLYIMKVVPNVRGLFYLVRYSSLVTYV